MIVPFELEVFFFLEKIYNRLMILLLEWNSIELKTVSMRRNAGMKKVFINQVCFAEKVVFSVSFFREG